MPVLVELFLETWEDQGHCMLERSCWGGSLGMVHCGACCPWINPPASCLIPDHGPSFNTAGDHCTCKFPPSLPCHSLLHLLWLNSSWGWVCSQPEEMGYFKIQGVAGWLCTVTVWQEAQTLCSFSPWLSRPRDSPGLDLNMARQEGDRWWRSHGVSAEQLELPDASSHLGLFDQEWVNGRRTCSLRRTQGSEQLWRKDSPGRAASLWSFLHTQAAILESQMPGEPRCVFFNSRWTAPLQKPSVLRTATSSAHSCF